MSDTETYSFPLPFADIPARGREVDFSISAAALPGIARRLEAESVDALKAQITLSRRGDMIFVTGTVTAELGRVCVSSLEPMAEHVSDSFELELQIVDELPDLAGELEVDLDAPEPVAGDSLDLAELAVQQVSLAMDPFPRKDGAEPVKDEGTQPSLSPFAVLKQAQED